MSGSGASLLAVDARVNRASTADLPARGACAASIPDRLKRRPCMTRRSTSHRLARVLAASVAAATLAAPAAVAMPDRGPIIRERCPRRRPRSSVRAIDAGLRLGLGRARRRRCRRADRAGVARRGRAREPPACPGRAMTARLVSLLAAVTITLCMAPAASANDPDRHKGGAVVAPADATLGGRGLGAALRAAGIRGRPHPLSEGGTQGCPRDRRPLHHRARNHVHARLRDRLEQRLRTPFPQTRAEQLGQAIAWDRANVASG